MSEKSIQQWFEEVEDKDFRTLLLNKKGGRSDWEKTNATYLYSAINTGKDWSSTDEGMYFWNSIHDKLRSNQSVEKIVQEQMIISKITSRISDCKNGAYTLRQESGHLSKILYHVGIFGNCQNFQVGYMENLLQSYVPVSDVKGFISYLRKKAGGKKILMVDIHQNKVDQLKAIFPNIILEAPYTSTNNSLMCILLVNVSNL